MKTIEELVDELEFTFEQKYSVLSEYEIYRKGIEVGLRAAQRWIPIEEELPPNEELVQVKYIEMMSGQTLYDHDRYHTNYEMFEIEQSVTVRVTHWRPIEIL